MMNEVARAESTALPGQLSMAGTDVDRRKEPSEPLMERIDQVAERVVGSGKVGTTGTTGKEEPSS